MDPQRARRYHLHLQLRQALPRTIDFFGSGFAYVGTIPRSIDAISNRKIHRSSLSIFHHHHEDFVSSRNVYDEVTR